jgi:hypothetical protein
MQEIKNMAELNFMAEIMASGQDKLRDLLGEERQLLTQFMLVTREQEQLIAAEDGEALSHNLERRQEIIGQVDNLLSEIIPLWQIQADSPGWAPSLNDLHEDIERILRETSEMDRRNQLAIGRSMDFLRGQMRLAGETRRGAETYIKGAETFSAGYVDARQ